MLTCFKYTPILIKYTLVGSIAVIFLYIQVKNNNTTLSNFHQPLSGQLYLFDAMDLLHYDSSYLFHIHYLKSSYFKCEKVYIIIYSFLRFSHIP